MPSEVLDSVKESRCKVSDIGKRLPPLKPAITELSLGMPYKNKKIQSHKRFGKSQTQNIITIIDDDLTDASEKSTSAGGSSVKSSTTQGSNRSTTTSTINNKPRVKKKLKKTGRHAVVQQTEDNKDGTASPAEDTQWTNIVQKINLSSPFPPKPTKTNNYRQAKRTDKRRLKVAETGDTRNNGVKAFKTTRARRIMNTNILNSSISALDENNFEERLEDRRNRLDAYDYHTDQEKPLETSEIDTETEQEVMVLPTSKCFIESKKTNSRCMECTSAHFLTHEIGVNIRVNSNKR